jgi:hypothetical protein
MLSGAIKLTGITPIASKLTPTVLFRFTLMNPSIPLWRKGLR